MILQSWFHCYPPVGLTSSEATRCPVHVVALFHSRNRFDIDPSGGVHLHGLRHLPTGANIGITVVWGNRAAPLRNPHPGTTEWAGGPSSSVGEGYRLLRYVDPRAWIRGENQPADIFEFGIRGAEGFGRQLFEPFHDNSGSPVETPNLQETRDSPVTRCARDRDYLFVAGNNRLVPK
jgi:hypothetical protein